MAHGRYRIKVSLHIGTDTKRNGSKWRESLKILGAIHEHTKPNKPHNYHNSTENSPSRKRSIERIEPTAKASFQSASIKINSLKAQPLKDPSISLEQPSASTMDLSTRDDGSSRSPHRVVLSLKDPHYKSIMHAHFRLLGSSTKSTGSRSEFDKTVERQIATMVFDMLRCSHSNISNGGKMNESDDMDISDSEDEGTDVRRPVEFYRIVRWDRKKGEERVEDGWALGSE